MRRIFASARVTAPCVVFFDEVDAIAGDRGAFLQHIAPRVVCVLVCSVAEWQLTRLQMFPCFRPSGAQGRRLTAREAPKGSCLSC